MLEHITTVSTVKGKFFGPMQCSQHVGGVPERWVGLDWIGLVWLVSSRLPFLTATVDDAVISLSVVEESSLSLSQSIIIYRSEAIRLFCLPG